MNIHIFYLNSVKFSVISNNNFFFFFCYEFSCDEHPCDVANSRPQALCFP